MTADNPTIRRPIERPRIGGAAALYLALALILAIPYFLLVVDYPAASSAADKVALIDDHYPSMYVVYLATYVAFGIALGALALALRDRLGTRAPFTMRIATGIGLLWAIVLVASGLIFTFGMTVIEDLAATDPAGAVSAWQAIEPVALALGGAGGELLGGLWVLLVSVVALRSRGLPTALGWLGVVIGVTGLMSVVPLLSDAAIAFGMLQIVWFGWLGVVLMMARPSTPGDPLTGIADRVASADPRPSAEVQEVAP
jgi:hypothetical protein